MKKSIKKSKNDLEKERDEVRVSLHNIRFGIAGSKSKNVKEYATLKKEIARINTTLNQETNG